MKAPYLLPIVFALFCFTACDTDPDNKEAINELNDLVELIKDPPTTYRTAPLWDWNDVITKEEINYHMEQFKAGGLGGVFVHPRPGLVTEYLSDEWNELFRHTVEKGKELDMHVWIYDENSYPSGFAGGHVQDRYPDSYQNGTGLGCKITQDLNDTTSLQVESVIPKGSDYYIFYRTFPSKSYWYGGFPYVDLLYPGVTDTFMQATMEGNEQVAGEEFGKTVPGVFTDEPNLPAALGRGSAMRWTPDFFDRFIDRWGYDVRDHLISMVEEHGDWKRVRHNYHELLLELFLDRWAVPWNQYCEENNLKWTGHYWEHGWPYPGEGYDESSFYWYHQMPGIDMLGRSFCEDGMCQQFGNLRAVRELASAANQADANRRLSETYGGAGWQITFTELKRLVDWECVLGVNFVNQHLSYFSMQGVRKFDYPPSFSYQEPWWPHYHLMGDYIARVCLAMSAGEQVNRVLIIQPNTTAWMYHARTDSHREVHTLSTVFKEFLNDLEFSQLEYDLGSEQVLKRFGSVSTDGLTVGQRTYDKIILPPGMENIDQSTLDLLTQYLDNDHDLLILSDSLNYVDGALSDEIAQLTTQQPDNLITIQDWFEQDDLTLNILEGGSDQVFHQRRQLKDGELLFMVNSSLDQTAQVYIDWQVDEVSEIDLLTGDTKPWWEGSKKERFQTELTLPPGGSILLISDYINTSNRSWIMPITFQPVMSSGKIATKRLHPNVLTIDYVDLETQDFQLKDLYFMNAMYKLFEWSELPTGNPWQHKIQFKQTYLEMDQFDESTWHTATYHFEVDDALTPEQLNSLQLVAERPEIWSVYVNGTELAPIPDAWWLDRHFPVYALKEVVQAGHNTIELKAPKMSVFAEIMPVYILGDFNLMPIHKGFRIVPPQSPGKRTWAEAGIPFYGQSMAYQKTFTIDDPSGKQFLVQPGTWKGTVAEVVVNGQSAGPLAWQDYIDVTSLIQKGENRIELIITGSLKNTLGFHHKDLTGWIDGPFSWNQAPEHQPPGETYRFMEYGLFGDLLLLQKFR